MYKTLHPHSLELIASAFRRKLLFILLFNAMYTCTDTFCVYLCELMPTSYLNIIKVPVLAIKLYVIRIYPLAFISIFITHSSPYIPRVQTHIVDISIWKTTHKNRYECIWLGDKKVKMEEKKRPGEKKNAWKYLCPEIKKILPLSIEERGTHTHTLMIRTRVKVWKQPLGFVCSFFSNKYNHLLLESIHIYIYLLTMISINLYKGHIYFINKDIKFASQNIMMEYF